MCGACYGACPSARDNAAYLGPHALLKALRFIEDSRDGAGEERITLAASDDGAFRCHSVFNCQTVCPKELDPSAAITRIKRRALGARGKPAKDIKA
jgi:succinate dehydrogenase / fumarate reductase iron-sulfur subunit